LARSSLRVTGQSVCFQALTLKISVQTDWPINGGKFFPLRNSLGLLVNAAAAFTGETGHIARR
jgi:hypothetical protein